MTKPFQRFGCGEKPLKRLIRCTACNTRLKPGVNGMNKPDIPVMVAQASGSEVSGGRDRRDTEVPPHIGMGARYNQLGLMF
jgi:hypothetical protein